MKCFLRRVNLQYFPRILEEGLPNRVTHPLDRRLVLALRLQKKEKDQSCWPQEFAGRRWSFTDSEARRVRLRQQYATAGL